MDKRKKTASSGSSGPVLDDEHSQSDEFSDYSGNAFYVRCNVPIVQKSSASVAATEDDLSMFRNEYKRMSMRRDANFSILSKLAAKKPKGNCEVKILKRGRTEHRDGITKEVLLEVIPKRHWNHRGISKKCDEVLGIIPIMLGKKFSVAQVKEGSVFSKENLVKPGDWIKSLNGELIAGDTLEKFFAKIKRPTTFKLCFHEIIEDYAMNPVDLRITSLYDVVQSCPLLFNLNGAELRAETVFSLIFISKADLEDEHSETLNPTFCFPHKEKNYLYPLRGSFVTLNSVMKQGFNGRILMSCLEINSWPYFISYASSEEGLLIQAFDAQHFSIFDVKSRSMSFSNLLVLLHGSLTAAFSEENLIELTHLCEISNYIVLGIKAERNLARFEQAIILPHFISLPKEIQLKIDDALSELEALDFCNWTDSEDVIEALREFVIIGCALYYKTWLIATHLAADYTVEIQSILENFAISRIIDTTYVKNMIVWQLIHPKEEMSSEKKKFVVMTSRGNLLMVAVLEEKIANESSIDPKTSLSYFVEEMQDILEYFKLTGVENLTRIWLSSNKRPECLLGPTPVAPEPNTSSIVPVPEQLKMPLDYLSSGSSDDGDDSDWEESLTSQKSSSGFDASETSEDVIRELQEILPSMLTFGPENILFHYVQIEFGEGVILSPITGENHIVLDTFRRTCVLIHSVLQNTIKFRQLLSKEERNKVIGTHRSLVAIKEHGVLINVKVNEEEFVDFWVIGRLFSSPPRELYVCHKTQVPQNLVELAFKICLSCAG